MHTEDEEGASFEGGEGKVIVDLNNVEDAQGFEVMPRAVYPVELEELEFTYSQSKGLPMWTWTLRVTEGEYENRKLFYHTVWAGAGLPMTKRAVSRIFPQLMTGPIDPEAIAEGGELLGTKMRARVQIRNYKPEGASKPEKRNNVGELLPAVEGDGF